MAEFYTILLNNDFTNNGIVCTQGLNALTEEHISHSTNRFGFFISKRNDIAYSLSLTYNDDLKYFSHVSIPEDAKRTVTIKGLFVDKVILTKIEPIETFDWNIDDCKINGMVLKFIKEQTPEICLEAVKNNGYALQFVITQTPEICMAAVKNLEYALSFVKEQTPEICMEAVKMNGHALCLVKTQTPEICTAAIKQNYEAYNYVKNKSTIRL